MRRFLSAFGEFFLRLLGFSLLAIPLIFIINNFSSFKLWLKIGGGSSGIDVPEDWQGLLAVEVMLGIIFLISLSLYKWSQKSNNKADKSLIQGWPIKAVNSCQWDIVSYSFNELPLRAPLESVASIFGAPQEMTQYKLIYPALGLDILYNATVKTVSGFVVHFIKSDQYKACPLRAKLNDGGWQTLSSQDNQQTIRSLLGEPKESSTLKDGFTEIFYWENAKIQIFYTVAAKLNLLIFSYHKTP
ncbi:MAG: hypothetical protein ACD_73C00425G0001 [uncultured bacterium]|nr:MAG: hypothetical protein ACD_73C00425G0001 [uncultured bacterium]